MPILSDTERVGTTVGGKYRLDRILGRGGAGTVFAGVHAWTQREVAVKLLHPEHARDRGVVDRFLKEARTAATLRHPNVVDVLDMGSDDDGSVYLVLELLNGESLAHSLARLGRLNARRTIEVLLPVMDALAEAHEIGIVHRDIKPENIVLSLDAKRQWIPKILDFGIAKVIASGNVQSTATGLVIGTPAYMPPEQVEGTLAVGPAADIWSMGVMLFECLSGQLPFHAESPTAMLVAVMTRNPPSLRDVAPDVPESIVRVVDRALRRDIAKRWPDMRAFAQALADALEPDEGKTTVRASLPYSPAEVGLASTTPAAPPTQRPVDAPALATRVDTPHDTQVATPFVGHDVRSPPRFEGWRRPVLFGGGALVLGFFVAMMMLSRVAVFDSGVVQVPPSDFAASPPPSVSTLPPADGPATSAAPSNVASGGVLGAAPPSWPATPPAPVVQPDSPTSTPPIAGNRQQPALVLVGEASLVPTRQPAATAPRRSRALRTPEQDSNSIRPAIVVRPSSRPAIGATPSARPPSAGPARGANGALILD